MFRIAVQQDDTDYQLPSPYRNLLSLVLVIAVGVAVLTLIAVGITVCT